MEKDVLISLLPEIKAEILDRHEHPVEITGIFIEDSIMDGRNFTVCFELRFNKGSGLIFFHYKPGRRFDPDERRMEFVAYPSEFQCFRDLILKL
jgi:hypothetical protein